MFYSVNNSFKNIHLRGKDHPMWNNGSSFEPYGLEFNDELREFIRKRDGYRCQNSECNKHQNELKEKLSVHHLDYDKSNNKEENLITLCKSCHMKSNFNRDYWQSFYRKIQDKRYLVLV